MHSWQLQDAKSKLSALVKEASGGEPQEITLHGKPAVIILSVEQYQALTAPKMSLTKFLSKSPLRGISLEIERDKSGIRKVDL